jgi:hypothetical protein
LLVSIDKQAALFGPGISGFPRSREVTRAAGYAVLGESAQHDDDHLSEAAGRQEQLKKGRS